MCQYFIYFYCSIIFHYMDRPQFTCVAIDIDRFVLNPAPAPPPAAAIISSSSAGLEGQRYRMGWGALLCNSGVQGRRPAFGCRGWGPKAEARRGGVWDLTPGPPFPAPSPSPRTLTGAARQVFSRNLPSLGIYLHGKGPMAQDGELKLLASLFTDKWGSLASPRPCREPLLPLRDRERPLLISTWV